MKAAGLAAGIALPRLEVPEPTQAFAFEPDDPDPFAADDGTLGFDAPAGPPGPMCDYVDLEAINALGILEYAEASSSFDELCSLSQLDFEKGFHFPAEFKCHPFSSNRLRRAFNKSERMFSTIS